ncbi:hypothetical protein FB639_003921 [Coemansia asiatica]|nr:hypothetical protein FB639_003921 [Coemansia asiatica]
MAQEDTATRQLRYLYWRFIVLGVASLMAWNVYIVSSDFFRFEFRSTPFKDNFESMFSVLSNTVNLGALCVALYTQPKANHDRRIKWGLLATVVSFAFVFLLPVSGIDGWTALVVALIALCAAAVAAAYIQCSVFGIAALLPASCAEGFMSGQAIAGTVTSAIQLASLYIDSNGDRGDGGSLIKRQPGAEDNGRLRIRSAAYFGLSALFLVLSTVAWTQLNSCLRRHPSSGDGYQALSTTAASAADNENVINEIAGADEAMVIPSSSNGQQQRQLPFTVMREGSPRQTRDMQASAAAFQSDGLGWAAASSPTEMEELTAQDIEAAGPESEHKLPQWLSTLGLDNAQQLYTTYMESLPYVCASAIVMGQTLAVFPPLTEAIVSAPKSSPKISNLTAWHFLLFNMGDYLGRLSTKWLVCSSHRLLHGVNGLRALLVPAFLLFPTMATPPERALLVHSDILFLALVLVLGWTNGWVATVSLILGPRHATNKELAGSIIGFAMCIGLVFGAVASYPILLVAGIS